MIRPMGSVIKSLSKERYKTAKSLCRNGFGVSKTHSHSLAAIFAYLHTVLFTPRQAPYIVPLTAHFVKGEAYSYDFATADPTKERVPFILWKFP